ncbi:Gfo/Idh/MocA family protein [Holdemania massiliensis]|uniref:Gfo/Idh/MocA family protein n=1 Tax=Holdemania massiliensis TaxID=1468449 RepID=UPI001F0546E6|nr:Gfo/Idh/MocA family oxidoreductase [Holdemania massiliensis]MCH1939841.1 Gfo/Idh/MocA family oxidoreductase [Holdemania massiliensis]
MNLGIMGSGNIVSAMITMFQATNRYHCPALYCRSVSAERGKAIVQKNHIDTLCTDPDEFLRDDRFDTVYVAVANQYHYEYVKKCLLANKHVLCEKPFTTSFTEAIELIELARKQGLMMAEISRSVMTSNFGKIKAQLSEIGEVRLVSTNLSHYSRQYDAYLKGQISPVFDAQFGGALRDFGIYTLHFLIGLFGEPQTLQYHALSGFNGVDLSGVLLLKYPQFTAVNTLSKCSNGQPYCLIQGEKGYLYCNSAPMYCEKAQLVLNQKKPTEVCGTADYNDELCRLADLFENREIKLLEQAMQETLICIKLIERGKK